MSILNIFRSKSTGLHCPRCEKPLEGHDEAACARRMSRRFFFGALAGGVAAAVVVPELVHVGMDAGGPSATAAIVLVPAKHCMSAGLTIRRTIAYDIMQARVVHRFDVGHGLQPSFGADHCHTITAKAHEDLHALTQMMGVPEMAALQLLAMGVPQPGRINEVDLFIYPDKKCPFIGDPAFVTVRRKRL